MKPDMHSITHTAYTGSQNGAGFSGNFHDHTKMITGPFPSVLGLSIIYQAGTRFSDQIGRRLGGYRPPLRGEGRGEAALGNKKP